MYKPSDIRELAKKLIMASIFILIIVAAYLQYQSDKDILTALLFLVGLIGFMPVGIIFGWLIANPYQRALWQKRITRKNYGVVHLVSRGKQIITVVKNFDYDLLWRGDRVFVLRSGSIYLYNEEQPVARIEPEKVKYMSGIPVLYFDLDNFSPLTFHDAPTKVSPEELAASLRAWVICEEAKALKWKKTMQIIMILLLCMVVINLLLTFMVYDRIDKWMQTDGTDLHNFLVKINNTQFTDINQIPGLGGPGYNVVSQINTTG